ncbi:hypothetical protein ACOME3_008342 [Neoechinorhynchus agilis]
MSDQPPIDMSSDKSITQEERPIIYDLLPNYDPKFPVNPLDIIWVSEEEAYKSYWGKRIETTRILREKVEARNRRLDKRDKRRKLEEKEKARKEKAAKEREEKRIKSGKKIECPESEAKIIEKVKKEDEHFEVTIRPGFDLSDPIYSAISYAVQSVPEIIDEDDSLVMLPKILGAHKKVHFPKNLRLGLEGLDPHEDVSLMNNEFKLKIGRQPKPIFINIDNTAVNKDSFGEKDLRLKLKTTLIAPVERNSILHDQAALEMELNEYPFPCSSLTDISDLWDWDDTKPESYAIDVLGNQDQRVVLAEYLEKEPLITNKTGMNLRLINYFKGCAENNSSWGEKKCVQHDHVEPFLGTIGSNQSVLSAECGQFRSVACFQQEIASHFVIAFSQNTMSSIRSVDGMLCVGQQLPMTEIPSPDSVEASQFEKNMLDATIYRLFLEAYQPGSTEMPWIFCETLCNLFPRNLHGKLAKRMKRYAILDLVNEERAWILRRDFRVPRQRELQSLMSPEKYCVNAARIFHELRNKRFNHVRFALLAGKFEPDRKRRKTILNKIAMVWDKTKIFFEVLRGECFLSMSGKSNPFKAVGIGYTFEKFSKKASIVSTTRMNKAIGTALEKIQTSNSLSNKIKDIMKTENFVERIDPATLVQILKFFGCEEVHLKPMTTMELKEVMRVICMQVEKNKKNPAVPEKKSVKKKKQSVVKTGKPKRITRTFTNFKNAYEREKQSIFDNQIKYLEAGLFPADDDNMRLAEVMSEPRITDASEMRISRRFADGRNEEIVVTNKAVIELYLKIRRKRTDVQIREILGQRKLVAPSGALNTKKRKAKEDTLPDLPKKPKKDLSIKCGACGRIGHMRTNRICPLFDQKNVLIQAKIPGEHLSRLTVEVPELLQPAESLMPANAKGQSKSRLALIKDLSKIFKDISRAILRLPEAKPFIDASLEGVMNLKTIHKKMSDNHYNDRESLLSDLGRIIVDSRRIRPDLTTAAERILHLFAAEIQKRETTIMFLERLINPLLGDDKDECFSFILRRIIDDHILKVENSGLFRFPVRKAENPNYYERIKRPMNIELIKRKLKKEEYYGTRSSQVKITNEIVQAAEQCIREIYKPDLEAIGKEAKETEEPQKRDSLENLDEYLQFDSSDEDDADNP